MFSLSSPLLSFSLLLLLPLLTRRLAAEVEGGPSLPPPPLPACAIVVVVIEPKSQAEETKGKKALFVNFSVYLLISKKKIVTDPVVRKALAQMWSGISHYQHNPGSGLDIDGSTGLLQEHEKRCSLACS